jgi:hypothetical protein
VLKATARLCTRLACSACKGLERLGRRRRRRRRRRFIDKMCKGGRRRRRF